MSEPPNIRTAFVAGTAFFSSTAYITAGTYALYHAHPQTFRYSFFTALNVGVAGGLFTGSSPPIANLGIRACLLHLPRNLQNRELQDRDYLFASGISAGAVGGTFNIFNSRTHPWRH